MGKGEFKPSDLFEKIDIQMTGMAPEIKNGKVGMTFKGRDNKEYVWEMNATDVISLLAAKK